MPTHSGSKTSSGGLLAKEDRLFEKVNVDDDSLEII